MSTWNSIAFERKLCWRVTRRCNLDCVHCLAADLGIYPGEIDTRTALCFCDLFGCWGVRRVAITGGEPLLRTDLPQIAERLWHHGIEIDITTNGYPVTPRRIRELEDFVGIFRVSIDGAETTHDGIRKSGSFQKALEAIQLLRQSKSRVAVNTVVMRRNIREIPELLDELMGLDVSRFVLLEFMSREKGAKLVDDQCTCEDLRDLATLCRRIELRNPGVEIQINNYSHVGDRYCVVEANGEVILCSEAGGDVAVGRLQGGGEALGKALARQRLLHRDSLEGPSVVAVPQTAKLSKGVVPVSTTATPYSEWG